MRLTNFISQRKFVASFTFLGLENISLGISINVKHPNIELHLPFCFMRLGWQGIDHAKASAITTFGWPYK